MADTKKGRISEEEFLLVKTTFKDNFSLLKAIRKVFFQMPLDAGELSVLTVNFSNKALIGLVRKYILPTIDENTTIGSQLDYYMTVGLKDMEAPRALLHLQSLKLVIAYLDQQLKVFEEATYNQEQKIIFSQLATIDSKDTEKTYINMLARNTIITQVEAYLFQWQSYADQEEKTPEQLKEEQKQNSSK